MQFDGMLSKHNGPEAKEVIEKIAAMLITNTGYVLSASLISIKLRDIYGITCFPPRVRSYIKKLVDRDIFSKLDRQTLNALESGRDSLLRYTNVFYYNDPNSFLEEYRHGALILNINYKEDKENLLYTKTKLFHFLKSKYKRISAGKINIYGKNDRNITTKQSNNIDFVAENDDGFKSYYICCSEEKVEEMSKALSSIRNSLPKTIVVPTEIIPFWTQSGVQIISLSGLTSNQ